MHDKINEKIRQYVTRPDRDPSKLYEDLEEILSQFKPKLGRKHIHDRLVELGLAEAGPSTAGAKVEDSDETRSFEAEGGEEEIEGSEEERPSEVDEVGLLNIDEVGISEVQDSDAYEAGRPSDAENSDEEPSIQISLPLPLPLPDSDRTGSSEGRIPISSLLNHDSDGRSAAGGRLSSIYSLLNPPPNTLEPEIKLKPDLPQITMKPV